MKKLEKMTMEDVNILLPLLIKMFKLKSSKDKVLKTRDIVTFVNNKRNEIGLKTQMTTQRLQKLINYIRCNSLLPIISTSSGYYYSMDNKDIMETILNFESRIEAMKAAVEGMRYIITENKLKDLQKQEECSLGFTWN